jgi:hypothetical protein
MYWSGSFEYQHVLICVLVNFVGHVRLVLVGTEIEFQI